MNKNLIVDCLFFLLVLFIYFPIINSYFLTEDYAWWSFVQGKTLIQVLTFFIKPPGQALSGFYRPLVGLTYWFNVNFFWFKPWAFHLTNLLIHFGVFILVIKIALRLIKDKRIAYLAGLLFLVFPFHSEAVAWIDGRLELLASFFYLLCFYFFIKEKRLFSLITFSLALASKEIAVTLPLVLVVYLLMIKKINLTKAVKKLWHYFLIILIYLILHAQYVGNFNPYQAASHLPIIISKPSCLYFILLCLGIIAYFLTKRSQEKKWQGKVKLSLFFIILMGIMYLPASFLPTQERYLYLPSTMAVFWLSDSFFICWTNLKRKIKWFRILMGTGLGLGILISVIYLRQRIGDWHEAGKIAQAAVLDFKAKSEDISPQATIYLFNLPDNYQGSYLFRTHVKEALEYQTGKKFKKIIVLPRTLGFAKTEVKWLSKSHFILTNKSGYLIFKPEVNRFTDLNKEVIDTKDYLLIVNDRNNLNLFIKNDYLGKKGVYFFNYNLGLKEIK